MTAYLGTLSAGITTLSVNGRIYLSIQANRILRTCRHAWRATGISPNASGLDKPEFRPAFLRFRIGTPQALEWTAFQENQRPYSGAIVYGIPLNVENPPSCFPGHDDCL
jgi:hypothetical protein